MDIIVVSWNVQGKFTEEQLINLMTEESWNILIALEPAASKAKNPAPGLIGSASCRIGGSTSVDNRNEKVCAYYDLDSISELTIKVQALKGPVKNAARLVFTTKAGRKYTALTGHAPFNKNDGSASTYQTAMLKLAEEENIDLVFGDLNTYGNKVGSARRGSFRNISDGINTSSGGHPLDKAMLNKNTLGVPSDFYAYTTPIEDLSFPTISDTESDEETDTDDSGQAKSITSRKRKIRSTTREKTNRLKTGIDNRSDHAPMLIRLPADKPMMQPYPAKKPKIEIDPTSDGGITKDPHSLYRCFAQFRYNDQNQYAKVRRELATWCAAHADKDPYLNMMKNQRTLPLYTNPIRQNACGGEFEIKLISMMYSYEVCLRSPAGFYLTTIGEGLKKVNIYSEGLFFQLNNAGTQKI